MTEEPNTDFNAADDGSDEETQASDVKGLFDSVTQLTKVAAADHAHQALGIWDRAGKGDYEFGDVAKDVTVFWERVARDCARVMVSVSDFVRERGDMADGS